MNKKITVRVAGVASLGLGLALALGMPAQAKGGGGESAHGDCSATSTWKLNAAGGKKDTIKIKGTVSTGTTGETWEWSISDNGTPVASDASTTDKDGKFKAKAKIADLDGTDTIDLTAVNTVTGETCAAEVVFDK